MPDLDRRRLRDRYRRTAGTRPVFIHLSSGHHGGSGIRTALGRCPRADAGVEEYILVFGDSDGCGAGDAHVVSSYYPRRRRLTG